MRGGIDRTGLEKGITFRTARSSSRTWRPTKACRLPTTAGSPSSASSSITASTSSPRAATARSTFRSQPDDPLFMGADGNFGTPTISPTHLVHGAHARTAERTASRRSATRPPRVDQNQTYTSHASHQLFLREYATGADGSRVATGKLLEGDGAVWRPGPTSRSRPRRCSAST